jgi:hypothetical protein
MWAKYIRLPSFAQIYPRGSQSSISLKGCQRISGIFVASSKTLENLQRKAEGRRRKAASAGGQMAED